MIRSWAFSAAARHFETVVCARFSNNGPRRTRMDWHLFCLAAVLVQASEHTDRAPPHELSYLTSRVVPHFATDAPSAATPLSLESFFGLPEQAFTPQDLEGLFRAKSPPPPRHGPYSVAGQRHSGSPFGYSHSIEQPPPPAPPPPRPPPWGTWFLQPLHPHFNAQFIMSETPAGEKAIMGTIRETASAAGVMLSSPAAGALALAVAAVATLRRSAARARVFAFRQAARQSWRGRGPPVAALV
jgi:hypothetical protein